MSNNRKFSLMILTSTVVMTTVLAGNVSAQAGNNAAIQINAANELVREGKITEAIDAYSEIGPVTGQEEELNYNLGIAHYRNGDTDAAASLFSKVAGSSDTSLASDSQYNLGNCHYWSALQRVESDKESAISNLKEAISFYRGALRGNPTNADARVNIELAGELLKQLKEEQKQEQQKQDEQNQDKQNQDQAQPDQPQQDQPQQDQQKQDQQDQAQQKQDPQQQEPSENSDSQKQSDESQQESDQSKSADTNSGDPKEQRPSDTEDAQSKDEPSNNSEQTDPSEKQNPQDDSSSQANSRSLPKQNQPPDQQSDQQNPTAEEQADSGDDEKQQPVPSGELKAANEQDKTVGTALAEGDVQIDQDGLMTREEALKMLQSVRDRDMLRRLRQQQRERSRHVPVDRDW